MSKKGNLTIDTACVGPPSNFIIITSHF